MTFYTIMYICPFFGTQNGGIPLGMCAHCQVHFILLLHIYFYLVYRLGRQSRCQHISASDHHFGDVLSDWIALSVMHSVDKDSLLFQLQSSTVIIEKHKISSPISRTIHFRYRSMGDFGWNPLLFSLRLRVVAVVRIKSEIHCFHQLKISCISGNQ